MRIVITGASGELGSTLMRRLAAHDAHDLAGMVWRARAELGWSPTVDAVTAFRETLSDMRNASSDDTAVLRPRSSVRELRAGVRRGPVSTRQRP